MNTEAFAQRDETLKLRAKLELGEQARLSGTTIYTLKEAGTGEQEDRLSHRQGVLLVLKGVCKKDSEGVKMSASLKCGSILIDGMSDA